MEFREKLQKLRKKNAMTQEDLAQSLYVSRTAVSKWESGRGYPNLESLRRIADLFSVTVDELLSGDQLLCLAEKDSKAKTKHLRDLMFGLLDVGSSLLLFLPFFAQRDGLDIQSVSLLALTEVSAYLRIVYAVMIAVTITWGILMLALQTCSHRIWVLANSRVSLFLTAINVLIFMMSLQPYAAGYLFVFLLIKGFLLLTRKVSLG